MNSLGLSSEKKPLISIVVAVYNGAATIESLLLSVINSSYSNIDLIVVDGLSTDGTIEILHRYEKFIRVWKSEKDLGIYDALNKGLDLCEDGSYVLILGADDKLLDLEGIVGVIRDRAPEVLVANVQQKDISCLRLSSYKCFLPKYIGVRNFLNFPVHHQGFLFKKNAAFPFYFNLKLGLHADYEFMARIINTCNNAIYVDSLVSEYSTGGASDYFSLKNIKSLSSVANSLGLNRVAIFFASPFRFFRLVLRSLVSRRLIDFVRKYRFLMKRWR